MMKNCLSAFISIALFAAMLCVCAPQAQARGWGHVYIGGFGVYGAVAPYPLGYPAYGYPYPAYAYPTYAYPVYAAPYPGYVASAPQPAPAPSYWYFCRSSNGYYPRVAACPEGWQQVPAIPPG